MFWVAEPALQPRPFYYACYFFYCITVAPKHNNKVVYKFMWVRNRNVKMWLSMAHVAFRHFGCAAESTDPCLCDIQNPAQHQQLMCYMRVAFSLYTRTKYSVHFFKLMQLYIIHLSSVGILISLSTYSSMLTGQTGQCWVINVGQMMSYCRVVWKVSTTPSVQLF